MIRINDNELFDILYNKYDIEELFGVDIKRDLFLVKFEKGEFICHEGDPLEYLHLMVKGKIKVNVTQENGKSRLIRFLEGFEILGNFELFSDTDYATNLVTMTEVYCFALDLTTCKTKLLNNLLFLRYTVKKVTQSLLQNNDNSSFNLLYPLETRLATYILLVADEGVFKENLTTVSELLATSYRHLGRVLAIFCDKGMIVRNSDSYEILQEEELRKISNPTKTHF